jgi:CRISPR type III-A-associated protein Csm2
MREVMKSAGLIRAAGAAGYFDDQGNLKVEFVSKPCMEPKAERFAKENLTMSQLRGFFNHCREIERRLRSKQSTWGEERANVARVSVFAADAAGKKPAKIPRSFREFLDANLATVHCEKDFVDGFMKHFEALVGFAALYMRKEERDR